MGAPSFEAIFQSGLATDVEAAQPSAAERQVPAEEFSPTYAGTVDSRDRNPFASSLLARCEPVHAPA